MESANISAKVGGQGHGPLASKFSSQEPHSHSGSKILVRIMAPPHTHTPHALRCPDAAPQLCSSSAPHHLPQLFPFYRLA